MTALRRISTLIRPTVLGLTILAPIAALAPAALLDVGTDSRVRFSLFPLALTVYDPFIWTCLWNSLGVALAVAAGSVVPGVGLGQVIARRRFWGRPLLSALTLGLAVVPPAFLAVGLRGLYDPDGPWIWRRALGALGVPTWTYHSGWQWLAWVWAASIHGTALVAVATAAAVDEQNPDLEDAARLSGASRSRIFRTLTWPMLRPKLSASINLIFLIGLADPGAPLLLGLRRTLGFQVAAQAMRPDAFPRIAGIVLLISLLTLAWRASLLWLVERGSSSASRDAGITHRRPVAIKLVWPSLLGPLLAVVTWLTLAGAPLAGLAKLALASEPSLSDRHAFTGLGIADFLRRLSDPDAVRLIANSLLLGLLVWLVWFLAAWRLPRPFSDMRARRWQARVALMGQCVSPVATGVGVLGLLRLIDLSASVARTSPGSPAASALLDGLSVLLDPYGSPPVLLVLGTCLAYLPLRIAARDERLLETDEIGRGIEQATLAGVRGNRARRLVLQGDIARSTRWSVLWATLAATSVAPAVFLVPTIDRSPLGPGIVLLANHSGDSLAMAATLVVVAVAANWTALAFALIRGDVRRQHLEIGDLA
jgi:ABC-type Fe3+ transport system permease subunit